MRGGGKAAAASMASAGRQDPGATRCVKGLAEAGAIPHRGLKQSENRNVATLGMSAAEREAARK